MPDPDTLALGNLYDNVVAGLKAPFDYSTKPKYEDLVATGLMGLTTTIPEFMEWVRKNKDDEAEREEVLEFLEKFNGKLDRTEAKELYCDMVNDSTTRSFHTLMEMPVTIEQFKKWVEENEEDGTERQKVLGILTKAMGHEFVELKVRTIWASQKKKKIDERLARTRERMRAACSGMIIPS